MKFSNLNQSRHSRSLYATFATLLLVISMLYSGVASAAGSDNLNHTAPQSLATNLPLNSVGGNYSLVLQPDGNLVEYNSSNQPVWYSGIIDSTASSINFQPDGNFVIYNSGNKPVFYTNTLVPSTNRFQLQDDGNIVIYTNSNSVVWQKNDASYLKTGQSITKGQPVIAGLNGYYLILQDDGNLVMYNGSHKAVWHSPAYDATDNRFIVQNDGNVVLYNAANKAVWSSNSSWPTGVSGGKLVVQPDGNLVLYTDAGVPVWHP